MEKRKAAKGGPGKGMRGPGQGCGLEAPSSSEPPRARGSPGVKGAGPPTREALGRKGPSGPSGDRSSRSAGDKRGPAGQGDGPKSSASSTNPRSPGLPGSLRPSLRAASKLQRLPKAAAEVSGQARAPKSLWSLGPLQARGEQARYPPGGRGCQPLPRSCPAGTGPACPSPSQGPG